MGPGPVHRVLPAVMRHRRAPLPHHLAEGLGVDIFEDVVPQAAFPAAKRTGEGLVYPHNIPRGGHHGHRQGKGLKSGLFLSGKDPLGAFHRCGDIAAVEQVRAQNRHPRKTGGGQLHHTEDLVVPVHGKGHEGHGPHHQIKQGRNNPNLFPPHFRLTSSPGILFRERPPYTSMIMGRIMGLRRVFWYRKRESSSLMLCFMPLQSRTRFLAHSSRVLYTKSRASSIRASDSRT